MRNLKIRNIIKIIFLTLIPVIYLLVHPSLLTLCGENYTCQDALTYGLDVPVVFVPLFIGLTLIFVIFFSESVFKKWKKFVLYAIPIMLIWIFVTPMNSDCNPILFCYDRTFVVFVSGFLYVVSSLVVIIRVASLEKKSLVTPK